MEGNWRPAQQEAASMASSMDGSSGDWRSQLQPEARHRIVNKMYDELSSSFTCDFVYFMSFVVLGFEFGGFGDDFSIMRQRTVGKV